MTESCCRFAPLKTPRSGGGALATYSIFATFPAGYFHGGYAGPLIDQVVGTAFLLIFVVAVIDLRNTAVGANLAPFAIGLGVAFLAVYVVYHAFSGLAKFGGHGPIRPIYFTLLAIHVFMAFVVAVLATIAVEALLLRTHWGRTVRAVADDIEAAELVGLRSQSINIGAFALACGLAGIAGTIMMQYLPFADAKALALYHAFERGAYQLAKAER